MKSGDHIEKNMKGMIFLLSLLALNFMGIEEGWAQAKLGIQSLMGMPATMEIGKPYQFRIGIQNRGTQSWTGKPGIFYKFNTDSSQTPPDFMYHDTSAQAVTLQPGDTLSVKAFFNPLSAHWKVGKNIVVIWPAALIGSPPVAADTIHLLITAMPGVGIAEFAYSPQADIFPNPASNFLHIHLKDHQNDFECVRIYNVLGETLFRSFEDIDVIPLENFLHGMYFVEIAYKKQSPAIYRFIKQ